MATPMLLSVPTLFGLESLAARDARKLGYAPESVEDGRVSFMGDELAICRANLWFRYAERVQVKMGGFRALAFDELFEGTKALPWPSLFPRDAAFPVKGSCVSSKLASVPDCQSIVKKAIVESMKRAYRADWHPESGALYQVQFNIIRDQVALFVDTSGSGLHKRGYREGSVLAPIRETLAAALAALSGWRPGMGLWDPFCGSGTIAIEAALAAANKAPGIDRRFAAESWGCVGPALWAQAREEARGMEHSVKGGMEHDVEGGMEGGVEGNSIIIIGSDIERRAVEAARQNAKRAGVSRLARFSQIDAKDMRPDHPRLRELGVALPEKGCVVCNPPYGERTQDELDAKRAMREWAPALKAFPKWNMCAISALGDFERLIGRPADRRRKLYNGMIKCQAFIYNAK
jgi:putative N6-adenine-specific DNA methylase